MDVAWLAPERPTAADGSAARRRRRRRLLLSEEGRAAAVAGEAREVAAGEAAAGEASAGAERYWRRRLAQDAGRTALAARGSMQTTLPFGNSEVFTMYYHQANDIVSGEVASRGSWELSETHFLATKMHEFAEVRGARGRRGGGPGGADTALAV